MRTTTLMAAVLAISIPAAAHAAGDQAWKIGNNSYRLDLSRLDLDSAAGRSEALARVERAAVKLCPGRTQSGRKACVEKIVQTSTTGSALRSLRLALDERASTQMARSTTGKPW